MGLAEPIVPLLAFRHALFELRATTARGLRRNLCYQCLRDAASEARLSGRGGIGPRRKAYPRRLLRVQKPGLGFNRAMATVSHCETA